MTISKGHALLQATASIKLFVCAFLLIVLIKQFNPAITNFGTPSLVRCGSQCSLLVLKGTSLYESFHRVIPKPDVWIWIPCFYGFIMVFLLFILLLRFSCLDTKHLLTSVESAIQIRGQ